MFDPSKYTKSQFLKAEDLDGGEVVTINRAYEHRFDRDQSTKPVLQFLEVDQKLVLNKTRIKILIGAFGGNVADWIGKRVVLGTMQTQMGDSITIKPADAPAPAMEVSFE